MLCGFPSNRVLPSAYADEISYYEQLNNLCKKINEVIEEFNSLTDTYVTIDFLQHLKITKIKIGGIN